MGGRDGKVIYKEKTISHQMRLLADKMGEGNDCFDSCKEKFAGGNKHHGTELLNEKLNKLRASVSNHKNRALHDKLAHIEFSFMIAFSIIFWEVT